jgi:membrane-associated phospholipid phosphatase
MALFLCKLRKLLMKLYILLITLLVAFAPLASSAQNIDTLSNKLDSLKQTTDTAGQVNLTEPAFYNERTTMNGRVFGILLLNDFKQQALSPLDIKGKSWWKGAGLVAATIGASFLFDKPIQRASVKFHATNPGIDDLSHTITNIGGIYQGVTFATIATVGFVFNKPKLRTTTALATQSYITSMVWSSMFKALSGRRRPNHPSVSPRLNGPFFTSNSSFPSQHSTLAFAAARVYAMEYKDKPIVPIVSYTVATLVATSRLTENKHWATDLVAGALLGWACGTQVVNNYHRYAKLVRQGKTNKKKGDISLNIQYQPGAGLMPGLVYKFR